MIDGCSRRACNTRGQEDRRRRPGKRIVVMAKYPRAIDKAAGYGSRRAGSDRWSNHGRSPPNGSMPTLRQGHAPIRERTRGGWKASTAGSGSFVYGFLAAYDRALRKAGDIFARRMSSVSNRQPHDNPGSCKVQPPPTTPPGRQSTLTP